MGAYPIYLLERQRQDLIEGASSQRRRLQDGDVIGVGLRNLVFAADNRRSGGNSSQLPD